MTLAPKARLGPYEIVSAIGAGGMGEVYRAHDTRLGRDVAVKVLPAALSADPDRLRRFEQEARAAGALNHPNILVVYDLGTHNGSPYLVSEFLEGVTLREKLNEGPLPSRKTIEIAVGIARGLDAAHEKGIFHRDLKPENIFLTRDGRVKILDFGLAKITVRESEADRKTVTQAGPGAATTEPGVVLGTVGYMSPEQVRGLPADERSDIFALGTVLYEMLSGRRAFQRDSSVETMSAILKQQPPELSTHDRNVSPALERLVNHCLEKNPDDRFQSARDLAFNLEALSEISTLGAVQPAAAAARSLLSRPVLASLIAAVGLSLAGLVVYFLARAAARPQPQFQRLTFRSGTVYSARFAPDGQTIWYSATWQGAPIGVYSTLPGSPESRPLGLPEASELVSISSGGQLALLLDARRIADFEVGGTLAEMPSLGGAPREVLAHVSAADWFPDGKNLAVVRDVPGAERLEYPIGKVLYETQGWIGDLRVSPQGDRIAFADHPTKDDDGGAVAVVGLAGAKKTLTRQWASLRGLAWSPSGDQIWFTASPAANAALYSVTVSGRTRLVERMAGNFRLRDVSRDSRVLANLEDERLELVGGQIGSATERDLSWFDWSFLDDITAGGNTVLFTESGEAGGPDYTIYLRNMDGSPAVRLGTGGRAIAISPDGRWALALHIHAPNRGLFLLPTGPGQPQDIPHSQTNLNASWFPDSKHILFTGIEPQHGARVYTQSIDGDAPRAISPEGVTAGDDAVSPNGQTFYARDLATQEWTLYPTNGTAPRAIPGLQAGEIPIRWSADGRSLFLVQYGVVAKVFRLDLATGKRQLLKVVAPSAPAGVVAVAPLTIAADGKSYAYCYERFLSDLYLIRGLR